VKKTGLIAIAATSLALAACSAEKPVSNEEAVPQLLAKTVDMTPEQMLKRKSSQILEEFATMAIGFAGDKKDAWDKARFDKELDAAYAPLAAQIDARFAKAVAGKMEDGQGAELLAMLDDEDTAKIMKCAFSPKTGEQGDPWTHCEGETGAKASEEARAGFNTAAGYFADVLLQDETLAAAMGYATCGVIAKYGEDISRDNLQISFDTTEIGPAGVKIPCPEYDRLAADLLTGDLPAHFPEAATGSGSKAGAKSGGGE
jgi:hypothetical protein